MHCKVAGFELVLHQRRSLWQIVRPATRPRLSQSQDSRRPAILEYPQPSNCQAGVAGSPAVSGRLPKDVLDAGPWLAGFCNRWPRAPAAAEAVAVAAVCSRMPPRPAGPAPVVFMPPLPAPKGNFVIGARSASAGTNRLLLRLTDSGPIHTSNYRTSRLIGLQPQGRQLAEYRFLAERIRHDRQM